MISVVKDSVTATGARLTTVLTDDLRYVTALGEPFVVTGEPGRMLVTSPHPVIDLPGVVIVPRLVDDTWLHAPFLSPDEWARLDLPVCGTLSAARCARTGGRGDQPSDDIELYLRLLTGPWAARRPLHHVALPVSHTAFEGLDVAEGRFPGWITWAEMLRWRGEPW